MRFLTLTILLFLSLRAASAPPARSVLNGRITDTSGAPLPGAVVELPDLHVGAAANTDGQYLIENLPSGRFLVTVKLIGFATQSVTVLLNGPTTQDFVIKEAVLEQHEVIVTGTSAATDRRRSPTPVQSLSSRQMRENASTNIIDAITSVPGVQQVTTGPAVSKPVIRGLGGNRIVTLNDGIRQEGQQWGDEHGIEIDDYNVSKVEVIKGPASLSYGSDAIAGVINILSEEPAPIGSMSGNIIAGYQTNNGLGSLHGRLSGNEKGLYWSGWYTGKRAHDYRNSADGYVFNTRFNNDDYGATVGISRHWGSSRLSFTSFNQELGLAEGERDSLSGHFVVPVNRQGAESLELFSEADGKSYEVAIPRQRINHRKLAWVSTIYGANGGRAGLTLGYQQNLRREFDDVVQPDEPGLYLQLQTLSYGLQYLFPQKPSGWQISAGVNGMYQLNENKGIEFLVPDYRLFDIGGYALLRKEWGRLTLSGGLRADYRSLSASSLYLDSTGARIPEDEAGSNSTLLFGPIRTGFSSPSGSMGISYEVAERTALKLNLASGYRAPNIAELSANGVHEGAIRYEYGNPQLKPENSFQVDLGASYNSDHLSLNGAVFYNYIRNFIFIRKLAAADGRDSIPATNNDEGFPAFLYSQTPAGLFGGELYLDFHPHPFDWLHMEHTISYVQGRNLEGTDSLQYLPAIPAARWLAGLRAQSRALGRHLGNAYVKVELDHYFAQNHVFTAYGTESGAPSYTLVHASLGFDVVRRGRSLMGITIAAQNLGDVAYQNHLSRLRYSDVNNVTGRRGISGMGRNVSMQLAIPLSFYNGKSSR